MSYLRPTVSYIDSWIGENGQKSVGKDEMLPAYSVSGFRPSQRIFSFM